MVEVVAQGGPATLAALGAYEHLFGEGEAGLLLIQFAALPPGIVGSLQRLLQADPILRGHTAASIYAPNVVAIRFRKGFPLLVALGVAVTAVLTGVVGWTITKESDRIVNYLGLGLVVLVAIKAFGNRRKE